MGFKEIWNLLRSEGWLTELAGVDDHLQIAKEVEGKVIAVDLSFWVVQASTQPALQEVFRNSPSEACLKVVFERVNNLLRYGAVPVCVLEGQSPPEKLELLRARFRAVHGSDGGGRGNRIFQRTQQHIANMLHAMGLPTVQAPGEAEATCAALNEAGLADAVASRDGDALVFGATCVYHSLRLQTAVPGNAELQKGTSEGVQKLLGLKRGGQQALVGLALLTGGDYHISGAVDVGPASAVTALRHLLLGRQDDEGVLQRLQSWLAGNPDDYLQQLSDGGCTGCKRCGHPGNRKSRLAKHSKRNPCSLCPAQHCGGQADTGECEARRFDLCGCEFHQRDAERNMDKTLRRTKATAGYLDRASEAQDAYEKQRDEARHAAKIARATHQLSGVSKFMQLARPDPAQVQAALYDGGLEWTVETTRQKLLPLLLEWDLTHSSSVQAKAGREEAEFQASSITKIQGGENSQDAWRYLLKWERLNIGPAAAQAPDRDWLAKGRVDGRAVRISVVQQHAPHLVREYEARLQAGERAKEEKELKKMQRLAKRAAKAQLQTGPSLADYFPQRKTVHADVPSAPACPQSSSQAPEAVPPQIGSAHQTVANSQEGAAAGVQGPQTPAPGRGGELAALIRAPSESEAWHGVGGQEPGHEQPQGSPSKRQRPAVDRAAIISGPAPRTSLRHISMHPPGMAPVPPDRASLGGRIPRLGPPSADMVENLQQPGMASWTPSSRSCESEAAAADSVEAQAQLTPAPKTPRAAKRLPAHLVLGRRQSSAQPPAEPHIQSRTPFHPASPRHCQQYASPLSVPPPAVTPRVSRLSSGSRLAMTLLLDLALPIGKSTLSQDELEILLKRNHKLPLSERHRQKQTFPWKSSDLDKCTREHVGATVGLSLQRLCASVRRVAASFLCPSPVCKSEAAGWKIIWELLQLQSLVLPQKNVKGYPDILMTLHTKTKRHELKWLGEALDLTPVGCLTAAPVSIGYSLRQRIIPRVFLLRHQGKDPRTQPSIGTYRSKVLRWTEANLVSIRGFQGRPSSGRADRPPATKSTATLFLTVRVSGAVPSRMSSASQTLMDS
ncbi:hypothetical protein WJX84_011606 [Apatococcus fuscideae]|uniref:Uncharacterized protein n=1 Tax=Apatococcus fuscideae TaxID=2026836 RepID=A0AAW1TAN2_9CHLO